MQSNSLDLPASRNFFFSTYNKKQQEEYILENFRSRLGFPKTAIINSSREKPDLEIRLEGYTIGCEITRFSSDKGKNGSKSDEWNSLWNKFNKMLNAELKKHQILTYGVIEFQRKDELKKILVSRLLIDEIVTIIQSNDNLQNIRLLTFDKEVYPVCNEHVTRLFIVKNDLYSEDYPWHEATSQSGSLTYLSHGSILENIVEEKIHKSNDYQRFDRNILIIYAPGLGLYDICPFQSFDKLNITMNRANSYFSHVFVFDKWFEQIYTIYPRKEIVFDPKNGISLSGSIGQNIEEYLNSQLTT